MSTSGNLFGWSSTDIIFVDGMIISNGAYLTSLASVLSAFGSSGSIMGAVGATGFYTPTASDADGDGETDEIVSNGTIIRPFDGIDYEFDPNIYITLDPLDFTDLAAELTAMFEAFCNSAQAAIDTLKNDYGIEFNLSPEAAANDSFTSALATLAYIVVNYGDLSVSNTILGGTMGAFIDGGLVPASSISIRELFEGASGTINLSLVQDTGTARTDWDTSTPDPNDYIIEFDSAALNDDGADFFGINWVWRTLLHEMAHVYNLNNNVGPWDLDDQPGYHLDDSHINSEHGYLNDITEALADLVTNAAEAANDPLLDAAFHALHNCDLDFG